MIMDLPHQKPLLSITIPSQAPSLEAVVQFSKDSLDKRAPVMLMSQHFLNPSLGWRAYTAK